MLSCFCTYSQVGINTTEPTNSLDINGDLRIRTLPNSLSTGDTPLVVDGNGRVKKRLSSVIGLFRGVLQFNYDSRAFDSLPSNIFHIRNIGQIVDPNNDFDNASDVFTAPVTGLYEITMTVTIRGLATPASNYVVGLINLAGNGNWVMRYSFKKESVEGTGTAVGVAKTYTGIARLFAGQRYAFGLAAGDFFLFANPTGSTGTGIGSYFKIELLDNN